MHNPCLDTPKNFQQSDARGKQLTVNIVSNNPRTWNFNAVATLLHKTDSCCQHFTFTPCTEKLKTHRKSVNETRPPSLRNFPYKSTTGLLIPRDRQQGWDAKGVTTTSFIPTIQLYNSARLHPHRRKFVVSGRKQPTEGIDSAVNEHSGAKTPPSCALCTFIKLAEVHKL